MWEKGRRWGRKTIAQGYEESNSRKRKRFAVTLRQREPRSHRSCLQGFRKEGKDCLCGKTSDLKEGLGAWKKGVGGGLRGAKKYFFGGITKIKRRAPVSRGKKEQLHPRGEGEAVRQTSQKKKGFEKGF